MTLTLISAAVASPLSSVEGFLVNLPVVKYSEIWTGEFVLLLNVTFTSVMKIDKREERCDISLVQ